MKYGYDISGRKIIWAQHRIADSAVLRKYETFDRTREAMSQNSNVWLFFLESQYLSRLYEAAISPFYLQEIIVTILIFQNMKTEGLGRGSSGFRGLAAFAKDLDSVSCTHLDVYKHL